MRFFRRKVTAANHAAQATLVGGSLASRPGSAFDLAIVAEAMAACLHRRRGDPFRGADENEAEWWLVREIEGMPAFEMAAVRHWKGEVVQSFAAGGTEHANLVCRLDRPRDEIGPGLNCRTSAPPPDGGGRQCLLLISLRKLANPPRRT